MIIRRPKIFRFIFRDEGNDPRELAFAKRHSDEKMFGREVDHADPTAQASEGNAEVLRSEITNRLLKRIETMVRRVEHY